MNAPWIQARPSRVGERGQRVDLVTPTVAQIDFRAVAAVLARVARFGAHTDEVLSVAQHCIEGARAIVRDIGNTEAAAAFLIHDAHEYLIGDIPTPVRDGIAAHAVLVSGDIAAGPLVKNAIQSLKSTLDKAIHEAAGVPWPLSRETLSIVKTYDLRMGRTERDARLAPTPCLWDSAWEQAEPVTGCDLSVRGEQYVRGMYWQACTELLPAFAITRCVPRYRGPAE